MEVRGLVQGQARFFTSKAPLLSSRHAILRQNASMAPKQTRHMHICQALVLVPSGDWKLKEAYSRRVQCDGTQDHLDDEVPAPTEIPLEDGQYEVGRGEDATLRIALPTVSSKHAILRIDGDSVSVTDLGSTNGTFINDNELRATKAETLKIGQNVTFGDCYLARFDLEKRE